MSDGRRDAAQARRFLGVFAIATLAGAALFAAGLGLLAWRGLLPHPPITATWCINEKFAFLRTAPLADRTLVAVGSSATWRNLDLPALERLLPGTRALNAAPCYLQVDQTAHLTRFLLPRMPSVDTVLVVLAPRDFERCAPEDTAVFDPALAGAHLAGLAPGWLIHLLRLQPFWTAREAWRRHRLRGIAAERYATDPLGSSVLRQPGSYAPPPAPDARCDVALTGLEALVAASGARLVVATLPVQPAWAARFDPTGAIVEDWTRRVAAALRAPDTLMVDGRALDWDDSRFADAVHVLYPHHTAFTAFLAEALAAPRPIRLARD